MYTVKILSNDEFDKLPYSKTKTSLGMADPKTNIAYIRDTGYNDITKATIGHELDELIAKTSPHEVDGIRYKDLGSSLSGLFGGGAKQAAPTNNPFSSFNPVGSGSTFNLGNNSGSGALAGFQKAAAPAAKAMAPMTQPAQSGGFFGGIKDTLKQAAPGAALSMAGNLFAPKVPTPDFSGITNGLRNQVSGTNGAGSEFRALGGDELKRILTTPIDAPPATAFNEGDIYAERKLTDDLNNLNKQFKQVNPTADVSNNSALLREQEHIIRDSREQRTAARDALSYQHEQAAIQTRYNTMVQALNIDQSQMNQLIELAQLDIGQIMIQTGITQAEATQMKELFGNLGSLVTQKSMGLLPNAMNQFQTTGAK